MQEQITMNIIHTFYIHPKIYIGRSPINKHWVRHEVPWDMPNDDIPHLKGSRGQSAAGGYIRHRALGHKAFVVTLFATKNLHH